MFSKSLKLPFEFYFDSILCKLPGSSLKEITFQILYKWNINIVLHISFSLSYRIKEMYLIFPPSTMLMPPDDFQVT